MITFASFDALNTRRHCFPTADVFVSPHPHASRRKNIFVWLAPNKAEQLYWNFITSQNKTRCMYEDMDYN